MPKIRITTERFPHSNPWGVSNRHDVLDVSIGEILHAAITVGHPNYSVVLGGGSFAAAYEMIWKAASTMMTLGSVHGTYDFYFTLTDRFENLDPSEKRGATYQLGLTFNKLLAWRLMGIRWLLHLDVYSSHLVPSISGGRSRPDLIGVDDRMNTCVFEAKGRVSPPSPADKVKAKAQATRIVSVSGVPPALRASCFTYFRKDRYRRHRHLECFVEDPPHDEDDTKHENVESHRLDVEVEQMILDYYRPLIPLFSSKEASHYDQQIKWKSEEFDIEVRMDLQLFKAWERKDVSGIIANLMDTSHPSETRNSFGDGIRILPGNRWLEIPNK